MHLTWEERGEVQGNTRSESSEEHVLKTRQSREHCGFHRSESCDYPWKAQTGLNNTSYVRVPSSPLLICSRYTLTEEAEHIFNGNVLDTSKKNPTTVPSSHGCHWLPLHAGSEWVLLPGVSPLLTTC